MGQICPTAYLVSESDFGSHTLNGRKRLLRSQKNTDVEMPIRPKEMTKSAINTNKQLEQMRKAHEKLTAELTIQTAPFK